MGVLVHEWNLGHSLMREETYRDKRGSEREREIEREKYRERQRERRKLRRRKAGDLRALRLSSVLSDQQNIQGSSFKVSIINDGFETDGQKYACMAPCCFEMMWTNQILIATVCCVCVY